MGKRKVDEKYDPLKIRKKKDEIPCPEWFNIRRIKQLTSSVSQPKLSGKCVVYWMFRDQRVADNWAALYAKWLASEASLPLVVVFNLDTSQDIATLRRYGFMLKGLKEVENKLGAMNIPFYLLNGKASRNVPDFIKRHNAAVVITDMSPLRQQTDVIKQITPKLQSGIPFFQVDAHNIVPVWVASDKQEIGARTLRIKINKLFEFLTDIPELSGNEVEVEMPAAIDWDELLSSLDLDRSVCEVKSFTPGATAADGVLRNFIEKNLPKFDDSRNDPTNDVSSDMSPYINFGQISAQRVILRVREAKKCSSSVAAFIEQAVIRRELSDNFCYYNSHYDQLEAAAQWARDSLLKHAADPKQHVYTRQQLEEAKTHDDLWNASQLQLVQRGKMHGFLRMYWAKKILEWSLSPSDALATAIYLNDKYELDGTDPNGYVGCGWSIMGIHDMGWTERPIFGKIRYMNYAGCQRKFDVAKFVAKYPKAVTNCLEAGGKPAAPKIKSTVVTARRKKVGRNQGTI